MRIYKNILVCPYYKTINYSFTLVEQFVIKTKNRFISKYLKYKTSISLVSQISSNTVIHSNDQRDVIQRTVVSILTSSCIIFRMQYKHLHMINLL